MPTTTETPTFRLGITLAGAVSAGAYTAGFMDYLFETLFLWEDQKKKIRKKIENNETLTDTEKKIPLYDVKIEAIGGASAGGIVGVMSALSLYKGIRPVIKKTDKKVDNNILYNSWVFLDDDLENNISTFEKMLDISDIPRNSEGVVSLLNSKPIDNVAQNVFDEFPENEEDYNFPDFISDDLRVLLTLCNMRGVPYEVKFQEQGSAYFDKQPGHRMTEHMLVAHFKTNYNHIIDKDKYLNFNPFSSIDKELIMLCTKATGAFPAGLASRIFKEKISTEYVKNAFKRNLNISENEDNITIHLPNDWYDFTDVDGGTINNEPYDEVMQVLREKVPENDPKKPLSGILMIDPFPNFYEADPNRPAKPKNFFHKYFIDVVLNLITTLLNQVRVKRFGLLYEDDFKILAFPYKWQNTAVQRDHPPLATGAIGGFGGFLDREFRKHDFFLGRRNARNILNSYFSLPYNSDDVNPLFANLTEEMKEEFLKKGNFPVIPDVNKVLVDDGDHPYRYEYDEYPKLRKEYLQKIKKPLKRRLKRIIRIVLKNRLDISSVWKFFIRAFILFFIGKLVKKMLEKVTKIFNERNQL